MDTLGPGKGGFRCELPNPDRSRVRCLPEVPSKLLILSLTTAWAWLKPRQNELSRGGMGMEVDRAPGLPPPRKPRKRGWWPQSSHLRSPRVEVSLPESVLPEEVGPGPLLSGGPRVCAPCHDPSRSRKQCFRVRLCGLYSKRCDPD